MAVAVIAIERIFIGEVVHDPPSSKKGLPRAIRTFDILVEAALVARAFAPSGVSSQACPFVAGLKIVGRAAGRSR